MFLDTEDVNLYYEVKGEGEPLLLVHGVVVDAGLYDEASKLLAKQYKVITYDRRGSSRSTVHGENVKYDVDTQIQDMCTLLDALSLEKVRICGVSAGAVLGCHFLQHHPERVEKLLMYEPPIITLLPERKDYQDWVLKMKNLNSRKKYNGAFFEFVHSINGTDERAGEIPKDLSEREMNNIYHALDDEYSVFIDYKPDMALVQKYVDKIVVAIGERSDGGPYPEATKRFAKLSGAPLLHFPGYHNLPYELPLDFAVCVAGAFLMC